MKRTIVALAVLAVAGQALAQAPALTPPDAPAPAVTATSRFLVQPEAQLTYLIYGDDTARARGFGIMGALSVQAPIAERTLVGLHGLYISGSDPTVEGRGVSVQANGLSAGFWGIGPVLTGFLRDDATYFSAAALLTRMSADFRGSSSESDVGFGGKFTAGHEWRSGWPVSVGLCASALMSINDAGGSEMTTIGLSAGLTLAFR
jgi:hypothetical protein